MNRDLKKRVIVVHVVPHICYCHSPMRYLGLNALMCSYSIMIMNDIIWVKEVIEGKRNY